MRRCEGKRGGARIARGRSGGPAAFGALALIATLAGCGSEDPVETAGPEFLRLGADQVLVDMEHFMSRSGLRRAHLVADTAYFLRDDTRVRVVPVDLTFYDQDGRVTSQLTAREGYYDMQRNDMEAFGGVVLLDRREGQRLVTEELEYDAVADRLRSDRAFTLYRGDTVLRGRGFETDPALDTVRVLQPAGRAEGEG